MFYQTVAIIHSVTITGIHQLSCQFQNKCTDNTHGKLCKTLYTTGHWTSSVPISRLSLKSLLVFLILNKHWYGNTHYTREWEKEHTPQKLESVHGEMWTTRSTFTARSIRHVRFGFVLFSPGVLTSCQLELHCYLKQLTQGRQRYLHIA